MVDLHTWPQATTNVELTAQLSQYRVDGISANNSATAMIDFNDAISGGTATSGNDNGTPAPTPTPAPTTETGSGLSGGGGSLSIASLLLLGVWLGKLVGIRRKM